MQDTQMASAAGSARCSCGNVLLEEAQLWWEVEIYPDEFPDARCNERIIQCAWNQNCVSEAFSGFSRFPIKNYSEGSKGQEGTNFRKKTNISWLLAQRFTKRHYF